MGLLRLETQLNAKSLPNRKPTLQQALDDYQPLCDHCRLAMHRHRLRGSPPPNPRVPLRAVSP